MKNSQLSSISFSPDKRNRIYCAAVYKDRVEEEKNELLYEMHDDIAVIFYLQEMKGNVRIITPVTRSMAKDLGLEAEELMKIAWKNTITQKNATIRQLSSVLGIKDDPVGLYVLSNEDMYFGAVTIFYPGLLETIAEEFGTDLFILPSSVHECLLLPCDGAYDSSFLARIVRAVNETEIEKEDLLSFSVYRFRREDSRMIIDNS